MSTDRNLGLVLAAAAAYLSRRDNGGSPLYDEMFDQHVGLSALAEAIDDVTERSGEEVDEMKRALEWYRCELVPRMRPRPKEGDPFHGEHVWVKAVWIEHR